MADIIFTEIPPRGDVESSQTPFAPQEPKNNLLTHPNGAGQNSPIHPQNQRSRAIGKLKGH